MRGTLIWVATRLSPIAEMREKKSFGKSALAEGKNSFEMLCCNGTDTSV